MKTGQQITFEPVSATNLRTYVEIGRQSYNEHYLHLWQNADPSPYIDSNFTDGIIDQELKNPNLELYLVKYGDSYAGIFKMVKDAEVGEHASKDALLVEKIYLLAACSGKGLGRKCLEFIKQRAGILDKKIIWLDTMKKGPALGFYLRLGFEIIGEKDLSYPTVLEDQKSMSILQYRL